MFFTFLVIIASWGASFAQSSAFDLQSWGNIIPLKSTRTKIEQKIGPSPKSNCSVCSYEMKTGRLTVVYSESACVGLINGWDVKKDVVLSYSVRLENGLDSKKVLPNVDEAIYLGMNHFLLPNIGVAYTLEDLTNRIINISFGPISNDNNLRCKGFPPYDPIGASYIPFWETEAFEDADAVIDNMVIAVENNNDTIAYVLIYVAKEMSQKDYDTLFAKLEQHLATRRLSRPGSVRLVKAGRRTNFNIESFLLPKGLKTPMPRPDFPSLEFETN